MGRGVGVHDVLVRDWRPVAGATAAVCVAAWAVIVWVAPQGLVLATLLTAVVVAPAVGLGLLLVTRRPGLVIGVLLVWMGTAPVVMFALSFWGDTAGTVSPMPGAGAAVVLAAGAWVWCYVPAALLAFLFPTGRLVSRRWRPVVGVMVAAAVLVQVVVALVPVDAEGGGSGPAPVVVPSWLLVPLAVVGFGGLLGGLVAAVGAVVHRYRTGGVVLRLQLRWFALGAALVPVVLLACLVSVTVLGGPSEVVLAGLGVVYVTIPAGVAIGVLRYDLYDIDRLISRTLAAALVTTLLAALFGAVVIVVGTAVGSDSAVGVAAGTLACAVVVSPLWRAAIARVDRRFYQDRYRALETMRGFVGRVRDGTAQPEEVEAALQQALADPALRVHYDVVDPSVAEDGGTSLHDPAVGDGRPGGVPVSAGGRRIATVTVGERSALRPALLQDTLQEARLALEVARLRAELRSALVDVRSSRSRLVRAGDEERRRLERDLHDGAQQRLIALGMALRHAEHGLGPDDPQRRVLDDAVGELGRAVEDLRGLAHGLRPRELDAGLPAALRALLASTPVPLDLHVTADALSDEAATTAYYVVAEAVTNALKHAQPTRLGVDVTADGTSLRVTVRDDGVGGADPSAPNSGLVGLADRVAAIGGNLAVSSPPGQGTTIQAVLSCGS
jgi:signal transduction histidine kinase